MFGHILNVLCEFSGGLPPAVPGQSPDRSPSDEDPGSSRDPTVCIKPKMPKIHPRGPFTLNYNFMNFAD